MSSDGQRAKLKSLKITEDDLVLPQSLFWSTRTRDSTPVDANNSVLAKNPSRSWVFWWAWSVGSNLYQPRKTIITIFSVPDSETGQQSSPHIQLKLMRRQPQQGNAERVLVENNSDTTSVTRQSKFSAVLLQRYLPVYTELKLFSITQTWTLSKLSDQGWISFVWYTFLKL